VRVKAVGCGGLCSCRARLRPRFRAAARASGYSPPRRRELLRCGYANSSGDVVFDPSLPFTDVSANINAVTRSMRARSGCSARGELGAVFLTRGVTSRGTSGRRSVRAERSGSAMRRSDSPATDRHAALSPASSRRESRTTLGASLAITAPTGIRRIEAVNSAQSLGVQTGAGILAAVGPMVARLLRGGVALHDEHDFYGGRRGRKIPSSSSRSVATLPPRLGSRWRTWYRGGERRSTASTARTARESRLGLTSRPVTQDHSLKFGYAQGHEHARRIEARHDLGRLAVRFGSIGHASSNLELRDR
jgi:hypothetical protein